MGKNEDELVLSTSNSLEIGNEDNCCRRCGLIARVFSLKCVFMVVFAVAVFLSAAFWFLPFVRGKGGRDLDPYNGAYIAASFSVQKPASLLNANFAKLQYDIYDELSIANITVAVISLEPLAELNWTKVVFGIWPYSQSSISSTLLSILREYFMNFITQPSEQHLTSSLFGRSYSFQLLRFPGGITIVPKQSVFLLQKCQTRFNFSLNFPIHKVLDNFDDLEAQMKSGLHLSPYENLYSVLTNNEGSTVSAPTIVQTSIILKVGNKQPSTPRLKQLAQTIKRSYAGNLGLNHTVFGRVKQIQLSSFLNHSLNSGGSGVSIPPSPSPQPHAHSHHHHLHHGHHHNHHQHHHHHHHRHQQHHHHQHHHHHHDEKGDLAPVSSSRQHSKSISKPKGNNIAPVTSPAVSPSISSSPAPDIYHANLPHVFLAHARPPSGSGTHTSSGESPAASPVPVSSSVAGHHSILLYCTIVAFFYLLAYSY